MSGRIGLFSFLALLYVIGMILGSTYEKHEAAQWALAESGSVYQVANVIGSGDSVAIQAGNDTYADIGTLELAKARTGSVSTWYEMATLRFDFITNSDWEIFWYIFLFPIAVLGAVSLFLLTLQVFQGLFSIFR